jgi:hypothetical protein
MDERTNGVLALVVERSVHSRGAPLARKKFDQTNRERPRRS